MLKDSQPKTITPDRGKEFSRHEEISKALNDVQFYFPEPHQPWQRGTNENTNGLLREYFPKKQDLTEIKSSLIRDKTLILNQRPRKCLSILQVLCKYKIVQKNLFKWTELNSVRFYVIRKISTCQ